MYGFGVRISPAYDIFGHFLFNGGRDQRAQSWPTYHQMLLDTRNYNIYSLGVAVSLVFEILGPFLFKGVVPPWTVMTYMPSDPT
jgi:hypothetical protein